MTDRQIANGQMADSDRMGQPAGADLDHGVVVGKLGSAGEIGVDGSGPLPIADCPLPDFGRLSAQVAALADRCAALERSDRLRINDLQQLIERVNVLERTVEDRELAVGPTLAEYEQSKGSITAMDETPRGADPHETPGAVSTTPVAPASGHSVGGFVHIPNAMKGLSPEQASVVRDYARMASMVRDLVESGRANSDIAAVAGIRKALETHPGTGELSARLLAVGCALKYLADEPAHVRSARLAGSGLSDAEVAQLIEKYERFEAGTCVPVVLAWALPVVREGGAA